MKINLLGTIVLIGGVASLTAACSGNPLRPATLNPGIGEGGGTNAAVTLSDPRLIGPALEVCTNQPPSDQTTDDGFIAMCDVAPPAPEAPAEEAPAADAAADAATEAAPADAAASAGSLGDAVLTVKSFHR